MTWWGGLRDLIGRAPVLPETPALRRSTYAAITLAKAVSQLGKGERGANNIGADLTVYGVGHGEAWCAAFVGWCLEAAWKEEHPPIAPLPFARSSSARGLWRNVGKAGSFPTEPQPGDLVCWARGKEGWQGHVALVESVEDGLIHTIEGNVGAFPAHVKRLVHDVTRERLLGYARPPEE
jgi:hypothetical protein